MKLCIDCAWFEVETHLTEDGEELKWSICANPGNLSLIDGEQNYHSPDELRHENLAVDCCGPDGKWWKAKDENVTEWMEK